MYKNKEDYQAYQKEWRKEHPNYFRKYYILLKEGKKQKKISLFRTIMKKIKGD
jgi:hypothetical protein